jgi:hypothetical protein
MGSARAPERFVGDGLSSRCTLTTITTVDTNTRPIAPIHQRLLERDRGRAAGS